MKVVVHETPDDECPLCFLEEIIEEKDTELADYKESREYLLLEINEATDTIESQQIEIQALTSIKERLEKQLAKAKEDDAHLVRIVREAFEAGCEYTDDKDSAFQRWLNQCGYRL